MIKVLVVDDDKLARQGLILSVRWEDFGMKVVGEAPNGLKALQFLDLTPVDLVLTDLAMPVMSGIDLMKQARERHREVLFAVLTFHEDFHYTQEALRLGAIDYISKLQLEKENLDTVLGRIRDRFAGQGLGTEPAGGDRALAFFQVGPRTAVKDLARALDDPPVLEEVGEGLVLWRTGAPAEAGAPPGWVTVKLQGLLGESASKVAHLLRQYQGRAFFYAYEPGTRSFDLPLERLEQEGMAADPEPETAEVRLRLLSMEWFHNDDAFGRMTAELRALRLPYVQLLRLLVALEGEWNAIHAPWSGQRLEMPTAFRVWTDVAAWLADIRNFAYGAPVLAEHSPEAKAGTFRALQILHAEYAQPLHTADVASRVHMSRSHFCLCFKQIIGESFLDYLSGLRLEKAKELLVKTDLPVYEVAERCGYADERYFGRLFKKAEGRLPSEFRRALP